MNTTIKLDGAGRVVIPKALRDELGLEPGDSLSLETEGDRVTIRPVRTRAALREEHGIWVFRNGRKVTAGETNRALYALRRGRDWQAHGS